MVKAVSTSGRHISLTHTLLLVTSSARLSGGTDATSAVNVCIIIAI